MYKNLKRLGGKLAPAAIACLLCSGNASAADVIATPATSVTSAQPNTLWRFMGIPQGIRKIRDVSVNRRGNRPGLERKPPIARIADPANLESPNPAIKAAAEIKQAEDMKKQKIKAIKYLATIGCGCYDKDGKVTEALLAATDDCTPDVRMAAIEAIKDAASGECCRKCGSTSCCNEKVSKRLSEIAYERDDSGCPLESSAEIRAMARKTLCICCPGGPPTGPIEEEIIEEVEESEDELDELPTPAEEEPQIRGESVEEDAGVTGESTDETTGEATDDASETEADQDESKPGIDMEIEDDLENESSEDLVLSRALSKVVEIRVGEEQLVGNTKIKPVTLVLEPSVVAKPKSLSQGASLLAMPASARLNVSEGLKLSKSASSLHKLNVQTAARRIASPIRIDSRSQSISPRRQQVSAEVRHVNQKTGQVSLVGKGFDQDKIGAGAVVYHEYLTGERMVGHLVVKNVANGQASAVVTDRSMLKAIHVGDRVVCR